MKSKVITRSYTFQRAYDSYFKEIGNRKRETQTILKKGSGAHPSIADRKGLQYTILDPDLTELNKAPLDIIKVNKSVQEWNTGQKYDLILSKMVLEHVEDPDSFHRAVYERLKPKGRAIHFFACRHSIPALFNRFLPESLGQLILKLLNNRDTSEHPKYPAFYRRTKGGVRSQIQYFKEMGYTVKEYRSYVGHKYFRRLPIFSQLEQLYSRLLVLLDLKSLATVALVVLSKEE